MSTQRKYLDRGQRIALEGRPYDVDWMALLAWGVHAARMAGAGEHRPLSEAVGDKLEGLPCPPRPALLDHPLLRHWLEADGAGAARYLRGEWGIRRDPTPRWGKPVLSGWEYAELGEDLIPSDAEEARVILGVPECIRGGEGGHGDLDGRGLFDRGRAIWRIGFCRDCRRACVSCVGDMTSSGDGESTVSTWTLYDQEAVYEGSSS